MDTQQASSESRDDLEALWMKDTEKHFKTPNVISSAESSGSSTGGTVLTSGAGGKMEVQTERADEADMSRRDVGADHQHHAPRGGKMTEM